jgi:hypothetical protein
VNGLPFAERVHERCAGWLGQVLFLKAARHAGSLAQLPEVGLAAWAQGEVLLEASARGGVERVFQVVSRQLDELLTGDKAGHVNSLQGQ